MKKILLGLATIGTLTGVIFATGAYFSDTETSTGNTFQAGAVNLKIDSDCHYFQDGIDVGCYYGENRTPFGNWVSGDLTTEKFFMFDDVKPGDYGENTLSLTVEDNDAWACMYIENAKNEENTIIDPETEAGDTTADVGELAENLHFTAWLDQGLTPGFGDDEVSEGDNIWQGPTAEPLLFSNESGPASDVLDGKVYDLNAYDGLLGGVTHYVGIYWCAGDLKIVGDAITCDGSTMGNESQTDSLSADVRFYVEQKRNNANFVCPELPSKIVVEPGDLIPLLANQSGAMRIKGQAGEGIYLGEQDLGIGANRVQAANSFMNSTSSRPFTLTYTAATKALNLQGLNGSPVNLTWDTDNTPVTCTAWDVLRITTRDSKADAGIAWSNIMFNATSLGNFGTTDVPGTPGFQHWSVTGLDLVSDWTITGNLDVANFYGNESLKAEITLGCKP